MCSETLGVLAPSVSTSLESPIYRTQNKEVSEMCLEPPVINLMNALAAQIVAAVHLFIRHQQQSLCSVLI